MEVPVERAAAEPAYVERAPPIQIIERAPPIQIIERGEPVRYERASPVRYVERGAPQYVERAVSPVQYERYGSGRSLGSPPRYVAGGGGGGSVLFSAPMPAGSTRVSYGELPRAAAAASGGGVSYVVSGGYSDGPAYFAGQRSPPVGSTRVSYGDDGFRPAGTRASYSDLPAQRALSPNGHYPGYAVTSGVSSRSSYGDLPPWR